MVKRIKVSCDYNLSDSNIEDIKEVSDYLKNVGHLHVEIVSGDYAGSIARFVPEKTSNQIEVRKNYWGKSYISNLPTGRLRWTGKQNKPKYNLFSHGSIVLLGYEGPEILKRLDMAATKKDLLKDDIYDIDGATIKEGDKVLYLNLRYGCGGRLSKGVVVERKAHARKGFVSVIIEEEGSKGKSECNYPERQIKVLN